MENKNKILGIFSLAVGIVLFLLSLNIHDKAAVGVGAAFFPKLISLGIFAMGIVLLVQRKTGMGKQVDKNQCCTQVVSDFTGRGRYVWMTVGLLVAYLILISIFGFLLSSIGYIYFQMQLLACDSDHKTRLKDFAISVLTSVIAYMLFVHVFGIMLPLGCFAEIGG
ncbi:MAG: tripartite tricarboxylate transporter TctB family protein [Spirochaetia bacterium]|jgi:hypothetical protein|nr:tripartite tricarboxylate transporter TctB family protein [Spirochaetia bacterium]